ncbi:3-oxoacyl-reductase [Saitoella complicata NRRL Y-17804]|uniref:3-oxoacyl-reductase n=1 Tax=Saitoella complicata (strain BCRC 22490 / CBS 7301 / JCM 7358 / NBRC 10748 / NRRL Y-17804) TaxID=698492 RepID=UPI000867D360|nr:3-oxoacyl-reductase [Saitoella complicata NRRL Y-17804]ODQ51514.1 3-oxoacyl-reductase [Saitoella complicata NRRL Y-17804]
MLRSKKCLVTGGSRGLGLAIAKRFSDEGATCILMARNREKLEAAREQLATAAEDVVGDVQDFASKDYGKGVLDDVDVLVNAAGITQVSLLVRTSPNSIKSLVQTNLLGTIYASQAFARNSIRARKGGVIINFSSALAHRPVPGSSIYTATKAAVEGLTKALAVELGPANIRVNAISPGYIETDMTSAISEKAREKMMDRVPVKRFGTVEEVAEVALMLAMNEFMTGSVVNVDGGWSV